VKPKTLLNILREKALTTPDQTGYIFLQDGETEGDRLTYNQLDQRARAIGALLQQHGAVGEPVLLLYPPGVDFIAAFFGCLYAGAIAVPTYPPRNKRHLPRIHTIVADAQARLLLTVEKTRTRIRSWIDHTSSLTSVHMLTTDTEVNGLADDWYEPALTAQQIAFLQYTSGSTSDPKGVMVTHSNLVENAKLIHRYFGQTADSMVVSWLPPYHDMGLIGGILQPMFTGCPVVLMAPTAFLQRPGRWLEAISRYRATASGGPNFAYDLCVRKISEDQRGTLDLSSWEVAFNGAEPVQAETLHRFAAAFAPCGFRPEAFFPCYGLAEATLFVSGGPKTAPPVVRTFDAAALEAHQIVENNAEHATGQSLVGSGQIGTEQQIAIVNPDTLTRCAPDQIGEIWIAGQCVTQGYWKRPELTAASFHAHQSETGEGPFLRTGDLGFIRDNELFVTGRLKDLIIIRGRNHYPQDIEHTVEQSYPAIRWNSSAAFSVEIDGEEHLVVVAEVERRYRPRRGISFPEQAYNAPERRHLPERRYSPRPDPLNPEIPYRFEAETAVAAIRQAVAENHELAPGALVFLKYGTIPKTSSGKIQRHLCKQRFLDDTLDHVAAWQPEHDEMPATVSSEESEQRPIGMWETFLAQLWGETLELDWERLNRDTHFFQLGGDSLNAITLTGALSDAVGVELDSDLIYQYPTLQALAAYLEQEYGVAPTMKVRNSLLAQYRKYCRPDRTDFPLLPLQQSFFITRALGEVGIYMFFDLELRGQLDVTVFQQALQVLFERHPALRLTFGTTVEGPRQGILPMSIAETSFSYQDLSQQPPHDALSSVTAEADTLANHRFASETGDTWQAKLFTIEPHSHRLLINFNHLALDGFSVRKWFEDLQQVYTALLQGRSVKCEPQTTLSFKEYVEIYTARQQTETRDRDVAYWMQKIPAYEPFPALEHITVEPDEAADGFATHLQILAPDLVQRLHEHARTHELTFFSVMMAAFLKLLALWSGRQRLTINTPYLNRRPYSHDVQEILGCFTDILPIRVDHILTQNLLELSRDVHRTLGEMHRHSLVSGVEIARMLAQKHHTTPEALSPIILSSALFPLESLSSDQTYTFSSVRVRTGAPATWLDVILYEACGEFVCSWNFLQSKFSGIKIAALAEQYERILHNFAEAPRTADPLNVLLQFEDFARWHRQHVAQAAAQANLAYWRDRLQGLPALQLPTDALPAAEWQAHKTSRTQMLPAALQDRVRAFSRQHDVPLQLTLLTAFQTLLYRYTGQPDVAVGVSLPAAPNTFVLRTDLAEQPDFQAAAQQVQQHYQDALQHIAVSFARLVETLRTENEAEELTLPAMFAYQDTSDPSSKQIPDSLEPDCRAARCDLLLAVDAQADNFTCTWFYNPDGFEPATLDRTSSHFETLLRDITTHPDRKLADLTILPDAERHRLLVEWNDTAVDYPLDTCIHTLVEAQAERTPDAVALVFEGQSLTYRELNRRANQLARHLQSLGVGPDVLVGMSVERSFEMVIGLLATLKAGGAYVPMDPEYPAERLAFMLKDSAVPVLLTQQKLADKLPPHAATVVCLDTDWDMIAHAADHNPSSTVTAQNLIYTIYTSGSTGKPKGAMNVHRALVNRLLWMQDAYQLMAEDRVLQKTPFSFDVSGWEFWWPLLTGARLVIAKPGGHKDSAYLVRLIQEQQITTMHFVPPMLQVFLEEPDVERCTSLRQVICSGEALPYELQERFFERLAAELHNLYGPTEAAIDVTFWACQRDSTRHIVPIGRPIANTQIYVLSSDLKPVPIGVPGELLIGGVNLARGYLNRPGLTREKFIPDPFSNNPDARLYRTGDLVRYLPDGNIEYLGRFDHQVKIRGFRIELGEIEAQLASHPEVRETVVLAREKRTGDKQLVAYLVPACHLAPAVQELREFLAAKLPEYMVPATFMVLDAFPLSPNGKIDRHALPEADGQAEAEYVAPHNATEQTLAAIWADLLGLERVGTRSNFFELGGHSLLVAQMVSRTREEFGVELPLSALYDIANIEELAAAIEAKQVEDVEDDVLERLLSEVDDLSEDEVTRQLTSD
jgi:amino acid adenylation domain-containing protein